MTVPVSRSAADMLDAAVSSLTTRSPAVLTTIGAADGRTLDPFRDIWIGEYSPVDHDTPGCGFWIASSQARSNSGLNVYDVEHTLHARMDIVGANADADTFSDFTRVLHMYAQAVQYSISRYLVTDGASAGITEAALVSATPEPISEIDGDGFHQVVDIQFRILQRVSRWEA